MMPPAQYTYYSGKREIKSKDEQQLGKKKKKIGSENKL